MDRDVKLLYRQRGSALRRTAQNIVISQAKRHKSSSASPPPILLPDLESDLAAEPLINDAPSSPLREGFPQMSASPSASPARLRGPVSDRPDHVNTQTNLLASPSPSLPPLHHSDPVETGPESPQGSDVESPVIPAPQFTFTNVPLSQLHSHTVSLASIEVLAAVLNILFEENLIPQSYADFETAQDPHDRLLHKIDIKLYSSFLHGVLADLHDLLDINISNNDLLAQLKHTIKRKTRSTQTLLDVRHETVDYENEPNARDQLDELRRKAAINDKLQSLAMGKTNVERQDATPVSPQDFKVDDFIALMDPHNGVLAQLNNFNQSLEKLLE